MRTLYQNCKADGPVDRSLNFGTPAIVKLNYSFASIVPWTTSFVVSNPVGTVLLIPTSKADRIPQRSAISQRSRVKTTSRIGQVLKVLKDITIDKAEARAIDPLQSIARSLEKREELMATMDYSAPSIKPMETTSYYEKRPELLFQHAVDGSRDLEPFRIISYVLDEALEHDVKAPRKRSSAFFELEAPFAQLEDASGKVVHDAETKPVAPKPPIRSKHSTDGKLRELEDVPAPSLWNKSKISFVYNDGGRSGEVVVTPDGRMILVNPWVPGKREERSTLSPETIITSEENVLGSVESVENITNSGDQNNTSTGG